MGKVLNQLNEMYIIKKICSAYDNACVGVSSVIHGKQKGSYASHTRPPVDFKNNNRFVEKKNK